MRLTISLLILLLTVTVEAQQVNIIPQPISIKQNPGQFILSPSTVIEVKAGGIENSYTFLNNYLKKYYSFQCKVLKISDSKNAIHLIYNLEDKELSGAYKLNVNDKGIYIASDNMEGFFYGIQSLIQLLPVPETSNQKPLSALKIPYLSIEDAPRFAYRGLHLDVSRHFFPVSYVKQYIDYIALHKMNYFHWHLTDDQGWRIEIKKYPRLTSVGAWRDGTIIGRYPGTGNDNIHYGGFYTQEQIKEVVAYAAKRYITVIPEIEMPGHSMAALAAYPQLGTTPDSVYKVSQTWGINGVYNNVLNPSEYTFNFLQDVLDEVMGLFPSQYIHIGGDECSKKWWHESAFCQQLMKEKGIKDEHGLQSYFIQRIEKYVNSKSRKIIGWDEILEGGLAPNATVMSWQGESGGIEAAKQNHDVVMTPGNPVYFDHTQSDNEDSVTIGGYNPIERVYAYEPIPKVLNDEQAKHILGAQANMWTEYMGNTKKVEYMLFPRLSALSEVLWSPKEKKNWGDFEKRLMAQLKRYDLWKTNYSKAYFDLKATVLPTKDNNGVLWTLENKNTNIKIWYNKDLDINDPPNPPPFNSYTSPVLIQKKGTYSAWSSDNGKRLENTLTQVFSFNKATGKKITLTNSASDKYPGDGAFTLVNGVINEKGFARTKEFIGFSGTDCEAVIDLGSIQSISFVVVNALNRQSSWIWRPQSVELFGSGDGQTWYPLKQTDNFEEASKETGKGKMTLSFKATYAQYVKVLVKNWGKIPEGNAGAGNKAWLFVDEIEVN